MKYAGKLISLMLMFSLMLTLAPSLSMTAYADTDDPVSFTFDPKPENGYFNENDGKFYMFLYDEGTSDMVTNVLNAKDGLTINYSDGTSEDYHYEWISEARRAVFVKNGTEDSGDPKFIPYDCIKLKWDVEPSSKKPYKADKEYGFTFSVTVNGKTMTNHYTVKMVKPVYATKVSDMYFDQAYANSKSAWLYLQGTTAANVFIPSHVRLKYQDGSGSDLFPVEAIKHENIGVFQFNHDLSYIGLPDTLKTIEEECFSDTGLEYIVVPGSVTEIGDYAFGFYIDDKTDEYVPVDGFIVYGVPGSEAEAYAQKFGLRFEDIANRPPEPKDISKATITGLKTLTYTGEFMYPEITVTLDGVKLKEGADYEVGYDNCKDAGKATVSVYGVRNYYGSIETSFKINKAANPLKVKAKTATVKYKKLKKKAQSLAVSKVLTFSKKGQGTVTYTKKSGNKKITINKKTGKIKIKKGLKKGTYKIKVKVAAAGNKNYKSAVKTLTLKIRIK